MRFVASCRIGEGILASPRRTVNAALAALGRAPRARPGLEWRPRMDRIDRVVHRPSSGAILAAAIRPIPDSGTAVVRST
jgi:hypothetical protein